MDEPYWWYGDRGRLIASLLTPFAAMYGFITVRRMRVAPSYRPRACVICVGNFTAGGTGKTPLVRTIAVSAIEMGRNPAILSRGYGGHERGPHLVDPASDTAARVGDEPRLLAATVPVCIARDRAEGARYLDDAGHDMILMDDGLQNPAVVKDLTLAIVDTARGLGNGRVIPAGPLRAPVDNQLSAVDAIVENTGFALANPEPHPTVTALRQRVACPVLVARICPRGDIGWLANAPVVAYAGIANPSRFFDLLRAKGADIRDTATFGDHQTLSEADAVRLLAQAHACGAHLVTTEKDFVRLPNAPSSNALADLKARSKVVVINLDFTGGARERLHTLIANALSRVEERNR